MNKVLQWMMASVAAVALVASTSQIALADVCVKPGLIEKKERVLQVQCPEKACVPAATKTSIHRSIVNDKQLVTKDVPLYKKVKRTKWVAVQRPIYKLVRKGVYAKKTVWVNRKIMAKKTTWENKPMAVETRIVEKPIVIEKRILVEKPIIIEKEKIAAAVTPVALESCPIPTVVQTAPVLAPAPMVIEEEKSHFLRFGLGPVLDFGLF